jgi:serine/threonine protein phosphatase PrpC
VSQPRSYSREPRVERHQWASGESNLLFPEAQSGDGAIKQLQPKFVSKALTAHWSQESTRMGLFAVGVHAAVSESCSEDAPPLFETEVSADRASFAAVVFDGMGGAGASAVDLNGVSASQAHVASRVVREATQRSLWSDGQLAFSRVSVERQIDDALREARDKWLPDTAATVKGSLVRSFPTTIAGVCASTPDGRGEWTANVFWVGDSRVYAFGEAGCLKQITRDDVREEDELRQLQGDHRLERLVTSDQPTVLNVRTIPLQAPFVLLVATDGLFHGLPTPGYLELEICRLIGGSVDETAQRAVDLVSELRDDDVSLVLLVVGRSSLTQQRRAMDRRERELEARYRVLSEPDLVGEQRSEMIERLWETERAEYRYEGVGAP